MAIVVITETDGKVYGVFGHWSDKIAAGVFLEREQWKSIMDDSIDWKFTRDEPNGKKLIATITSVNIITGSKS